MTTETSIYEYAKNGSYIKPNKVAIRFYEESVTYRELFEKIDNVADHLYKDGVREGNVITIHLYNCPQIAIAIYAVAKLGGICSLVHPLIPQNRLLDYAASTKSRFVITHLDIEGDNIIQLQDFYDFEKRCDISAITPDQKSLACKCAVFLHSSGTTGKPKTVMHSHAAMNRIVANTYKLLHCRDFTDQVVLGELPLFHGFGLIDNLHDVIAGGGQLIQMAQWDSHLAAKWIDQYHVTFMAGVPKIYYDLLAESQFDGKSLTHCYVGGEKVDPELKQRFNEKMGRSSLIYEGYGMAEVIAYCCSCSPYDDVLESSGKAMEGTELAILVGDNILPEGEGELIVSSNTMMMGYYQCEDDCFITWCDKNWFRTGDYVRLLPDGHLFYIERIKNIIVRNGYNIFPAEIESCTRCIEGISEACVIGVQDGYTQKVIAIIEKNGKIEESTLREVWGKLLPAYAIPEDVYFVEKIARNSLGKIDRATIRELYGHS